MLDMMTLGGVILTWDGGLMTVIAESSWMEVLHVKVQTTLSSPGGKVGDASCNTAAW